MKNAKVHFNETNQLMEDKAGFGYYSADWKASPEKVLELVDEALEIHGLEITLGDGGDDQAYFTIKIMEE